MIWAVRDAQGQDPGAGDKRLLVAEPEFASVLKATNREISTPSPTLRSAWDGRPLALLTRTAPARATDAHISIIGHVTAAELRHHTTRIELANGFLNRFLLVAVRRVRLLPEGGDPDPLKSSGLLRYLASVLKHAQTTGRVTLDPAARELWWHAYPQLTQPGDGLTGAICARAEAHAIRLARIYALLDGERQIQPPHLQAALALCDYAARSASCALGRASGDPLAEQIHAALLRSPDGLTRTQISHLLHRNLPAQQLARALHALAATGRAHQQKILTAGRPTELWTARPQPPHTTQRGSPQPSPLDLDSATPPDGGAVTEQSSRERKRSDLDSHATGATIIQVQGGTPRRLNSLLRSPLLSTIPASAPSPSWASVNICPRRRRP